MKALMTITPCLLAIATILSGGTSRADQDWNHVNLYSREGIHIAIDFQFTPLCHRFEADDGSDNEIRLAAPVWLNVNGLGSNDKVEVEIEFWRQSYRLTGSDTPPLLRTHRYFDRSLILSPAENGRFTGQVTGSLAVRHSIGNAYESWRIGQKIRVKVNGSSLIDPISGTDQFLVFLDDRKSCAFP